MVKARVSVGPGRDGTGDGGPGTGPGPLLMLVSTLGVIGDHLAALKV